MSNIEAITPGQNLSAFEALLALDQAIFDALPAAVYVCSADGTLVRFNRKAADLWGRAPRVGDSAERYCGSYRLYHIDGTPLAHAHAPVAKVLETGKSYHDLSAIVERPDGSRIAVISNVEPLRSSTGRIDGAISCFQDVTARQRSEQLLRESRQQFQNVLDALPAVIYTTDAEGRVTFFNRFAAEWCGHELAFGKQWCVTWRLYRPDGSVLPQDQCPMAIALKEKRTLSGIEAIMERPDGSKAPFIAYPTPLFDDANRLRGAVNMLVDISDRKYAETSLAQRTAEQTVLYRLTDRLQRVVSISEICEAAVDAITRALLCERVSILLFNRAGMKFAAWRKLSATYRRIYESYSPWMTDMRELMPVLIDDIESSDLPKELKAAMEAERIGALALFPLIENGVAIGKFVTYYEQPHSFADEKIDLALTIARQIAFAIGRLRTNEARRRAEEALRASQSQLAAEAKTLSRLNRATSRLWAMRNINEGLEEILEATIAVAGTDMGMIQLLDPDRQILTLAAQCGMEREFVELFREVPSEDEAVYNRALRSRSQVLVENPDDDEGAAHLRLFARSSGLRAMQFTPLIGHDGKPLGVLSTYFRDTYRPSTRDLDRLDLYAQQTADFIERCRIEQSLHQFAAIVESSADAIVSTDLNGVITSWNKGAERLLGYAASEVIGKPPTAMIPPERSNEEIRILEKIRCGQRVESYETVRQRKDGSLVDISLTVSPIRNDDGLVIGASKIARDITERKRAEAQRELLVAELSHRVKNTLASVLSIAQQTFVKGGSPEEIQHSFAGRVHALAQTHTRLAETSWAGVSLKSILSDELAPYTGANKDNIRLSGPEVELSPRRAIILGMAVHELATNAAKHGALSSKIGVVSVDWHLEPGRRLILCWRESGGPKVTPPTRSGFGSLLLERILPADLRGTFTSQYAEEGLSCEVAVPLDDVAADTTTFMSEQRKVASGGK